MSTGISGARVFVPHNDTYDDTAGIRALRDGYLVT